LDGSWRWRSHLVKSRAKCKARHAKHHYGDSVQGEVNLKLNKFPLKAEETMFIFL